MNPIYGAKVPWPLATTTTHSDSKNTLQVGRKCSIWARVLDPEHVQEMKKRLKLFLMNLYVKELHQLIIIPQ